MRSYIPNFTLKQLVCILVIISFAVYIHLWYAYYILGFTKDVSDLFSHSRRVFYKNKYIPSSTKNPKYILHWTYYYLVLKQGQSIFPALNCEVRNCIFTTNKTLLNGDYRNFDAVTFDDQFLDLKNTTVPKFRSEKQLYIFTSIESPLNNPACDLHNDNFYNWTWTYRLDSTVPWHYFVVRNLTGHIVAPSRDVVWKINASAPVSKKVKKVLHGKNKAAVWLVSHCEAQSSRDQYLADLQEHLYHYSIRVDVFGKCSGRKCEGLNCNEMIKDNYYFYMAFENSISKDYVSEKVLHGYKNYAIPIVYGGADYTRFLPQGSYINARYMHPYILASKMRQIIDDRQLHESFFTWTNSYSVSTKRFHPLCELCAALNKPTTKSPAIKDFRLWWNGGPDGMKWCLSQDFWNEMHKVSFLDRPYVNNVNSVRSKSDYYN